MFNKKILLALVLLYSNCYVHSSPTLIQSLTHLSKTLDTLTLNLSTKTHQYKNSSLINKHSLKKLPPAVSNSYDSSKIVLETDFFNYTVGIDEQSFRHLISWNNGTINQRWHNKTTLNEWIQDYQPTPGNYPRAALINNEVIDYRNMPKIKRTDNPGPGTFKVLLQDLDQPWLTDNMYLQGIAENNNAAFQIDYVPWSRNHDIMSSEHLLLPMIDQDTQVGGSIISGSGFHIFNKYLSQKNNYCWHQIKSTYNKGLPVGINRFFNPYEKLGIPFCYLVDRKYSYITIDSTKLSMMDPSKIDAENLVNILINQKTVITLTKDKSMNIVALPVSYNPITQQIDTSNTQIVTQLLCSALTIPINNHLTKAQDARINTWAQIILTGLYKNTIQACTALGVKKLYLTMLGVHNGTQLDWISNSLADLRNIIKLSGLEIIFVYRYAPRLEHYHNGSNQSFLTQLLDLQNKINKTSINQHQWTPQGTTIKEYLTGLAAYYQQRYQQRT